MSATDRGGMGIEDYESSIQTDAPINPGNSGGALVDVHGGLIGINTAILSRSGGSLGIGFAVPSDLARRVLADLVQYGYVLRGYLGIKVGDVLTRFEGRPVRDARHLRIAIAEAKPCQTFEVEVLRNGSAKPLRVILGQASECGRVPSAEWSVDEQHPGALQSVVLIESSSQIRQHLHIPREVRGAVVLDLHAHSAAAQAGLRPGDVIESINRREVKSAEDVSRVTHTAAHERVLLQVCSHGTTRFIVVED